MLRFITINNDGIVTSVRYGNYIAEGERESEYGDIGQKFIDGNYVDVQVDLGESSPSLEELQAQTLMNTEMLLVYSELRM